MGWVMLVWLVSVACSSLEAAAALAAKWAHVRKEAAFPQNYVSSATGALRTATVIDTFFVQVWENIFAQL